ncbi:MAG: hypothetical protein LC127_13800 [Chitinophagales bacterium]|nr:hypothetical protein [Chitinophagales bacterium]
MCNKQNSVSLSNNTLLDRNEYASGSGGRQLFLDLGGSDLEIWNNNSVFTQTIPNETKFVLGSRHKASDYRSTVKYGSTTNNLTNTRSTYENLRGITLGALQSNQVPGDWEWTGIVTEYIGYDRSISDTEYDNIMSNQIAYFGV